MLTRLSPHRLAAAIAVAFIALALAYGFANPPFEATDEIRHFRYARYLALNRALPPVSVETSKELQAHHPPLYYALAALLASPIHSDPGPDHSPAINPFWGFRYFEPSADNKNQYLHAPDGRWPFSSGAALIVFIARWLSTVFGLGVVLMAYRLGRILFPDQPRIALGAMAFVAFNPTLLHSASSLNNDAAATFFGSWAVAESAAIAQGGSTRARAIRLGMALGLGVLSKVSVAVLAVAAAAAYLWIGASRKDRWRWAFGHGALCAMIAIAIAGWWFARNYLQTGDPMGLSEYQSAWAGEADRARLIREALSGLPYAWTTVWARFDYGQIVLPDGAYQTWGVLCVFALIGLARARLRSPAALIAFLAIAVSLAGWAALMITIPATAHARHILFAFPALALFLVVGWRSLLPQRLPALIFVVCSLEFLFSLFSLSYLDSAFAYPHAIAALPADATPISANFEGAAEIVGYRLSTRAAHSGDRVDVTVYWRPLAQTATPLQTFVHFVDSQGIIAAQRDTYPGLGSAVTTTWIANQTFADTYRVFIPDTAYAPETLAVRVGLWNASESRPLIVGDADALTLGRIDLQSRVGGAPNPMAINFENRMALIGYALDRRVIAPGDTLLLTTHWRAAAADSDYWAYAHVVGADGQIWAIADSIITPPITEWPVNANQSEARRIVLAPDTPTGQYTLEFGLTRVSDAGQTRLVVLADDGHEIGDHIALAQIRVER
ncbi:MAG: hypothetical protein FJ030_01450 [Chloroflexi bacterium]|nr:hypothetical protein [Chloroflexota bacterium]